MEPPPIDDIGTVARIRDALANLAMPPAPGAGMRSMGYRALARDRDVTAYMESRYPGLGKTILAAHDFHRRTAARAVLGGRLVPPARGVIFTAAGLPAPAGPLHAPAAAAEPSARFIYADADSKITAAHSAALAGDDRAAAVTGPSWDPEELLAVPEVRELTGRGPVSVHVVLAPHRYPGKIAGHVCAGYGRLLPPGSTLVLSLGIPDPGPRGEQLWEDLGLAGTAAYAHTPDDVAEWITGAGMRLHPDGVIPARAWGRPWVKRYRIAPQVPGRIYGAVGIVR